MRATLFATILAGSAPLLAAAQAQTTPTTGATTSTETKCAAQKYVTVKSLLVSCIDIDQFEQHRG